MKISKKRLIFSAFNFFNFLISLFGYNIYSQPTKKNQKAAAATRQRSKERMNLKGRRGIEEQRTDTWRKERARKLRDPPTTTPIHPGHHVWSNQRPVKSRFGPYRGFCCPFSHTQSSKRFFTHPKSKCEEGQMLARLYSTLLYSGVGTDLFTFWATARASNGILARAVTAFLLQHPLHRPYVYSARNTFGLRIHEYMYSRLIPHIYRSRILLNFVYFRKYQISRNFRLFYKKILKTIHQFALIYIYITFLI